MGRGTQWSDPETKALIEAFVHVSEDALIGTNQSAEQLYSRVVDEAKKRYAGDWMRSADACKKRWLDVSKEVQKFVAAMKFVESVQHSGWNDDDYFKAAEEYYCKNHSDSCKNFKFVEEWKFLKGYEKWKTASAPPSTKRKKEIEKIEKNSSSESLDSEEVAHARPVGNKKQKAIAAIESKADEWFEKISNATGTNETHQAILKMMEENVKQSKKNIEMLNETFTTQAEKITLQMQKSAAFRALTKIDLSTMPEAFQAKAKKKLEEEIASMLNFD